MELPGYIPPIGYGFRTDAEVIAELILMRMEDDRDDLLLREMNGRFCAKRQIRGMSIAARSGRPDENL